MHDSPRRRRARRLGLFKVLLGGHVPGDPPEATLVLAAAAGLLRVKVDGTLTEAVEWARAPSLAKIATEIGLHVGAVRRGGRARAAAATMVHWV